MGAASAPSLPHIVVLGAGFGGMRFCQSLRGAARITLVDRHNHHAFQPLLYQVATAGLSAPEVAAPVRSIFRRDPRVTVLMETVRGMDLAARQVQLTRRILRYDALVIALGGQTSYFGQNHWRLHAPGLKSVGDAMAMRSKLLGAFEKAENSDDPKERERLTTVVVIGGGPTGVELAGAIAELTRVVFRRDFRRLDTTRARVLLIEGSDRLLGQFPAPLPAKALTQLASLGVEVMLHARVAQITGEGVTLADGRFIESQTVFWGAGVQASSLTESLGVPLGRGAGFWLKRT